ncbi:DGQHR domain-containing protein [Stappia sp. GBMRC 2046]|uniref:DGQHR domain-containing protein n=1 Tax=Stappia sediminis TaxID=2692190 RepID=A0A7X3LQP3_9HYPH|nr:DGQHR domain-containing protein [Stappia sediminis]MXN63319.1 DGQHR domain-containing protein [Stappia sediminis]
MAKKPQSKSKKRKKLTPEERQKNKRREYHIRTVQSVLRNAGFDRVPEVANKDISWGGQDGEFDDVFVSENMVLLLEYTTSQSSDVREHLKKKKIIFSNVVADPKGFLDYLRGNFSEFNKRLGNKFHEDRYIIRILYCSLNEFDESIKDVVNEPVYFDYPVLKYFEKISSIIKLSVRGELLEFLRIDPSDVAENGLFQQQGNSRTLNGSILPEASSGFPTGYKVVSFYVDAASLLSRAYVLRRDGWRGSSQAYQRMINSSKIESMRKKLKTDQQVFVNNLIATLPSDVHPEEKDGKTVDITTLTKTSPVKIRLPERANSIGMIDGQHRLFSYYKSRNDDPEIARLRHHQNLLVTGVIYPPDVDEEEQERFEAKLFLSINATQTNAPTPLRQEIETVLNPFSATAIGRRVMAQLAKNGPLTGYVEKYFFDKGKLKTSSIVSYALGPLLKLSGTDSLFYIFDHENKEKINTESGQKVLNEYINFSVSKINMFLNAVKNNVEAKRWTTDPKQKDRLVTVTYINSFLITMRYLIESGNKIDEFSSLKAALSDIDSFNFRAYHSSQYARMAENLFQTYFASDYTNRNKPANDSS